MKLSNFLTTIDLDSYHDKLIQLDWCRFIGMLKLTIKILKKLFFEKNRKYNKSDLSIISLGDNNKSKCNRINELRRSYSLWYVRLFC